MSSSFSTSRNVATNRMGDFNSIIDYPPAPKLNPLMRLIPEKASEAELRGEALFHGKAKCAKCHYGPAFVDDYMHDLRVERFYVGRPEGPIKTFAREPPVGALIFPARTIGGCSSLFCPPLFPFCPPFWFPLF